MVKDSIRREKRVVGGAERVVNSGCDRLRSAAEMMPFKPSDEHFQIIYK